MMSGDGHIIQFVRLKIKFFSYENFRLFSIFYVRFLTEGLDQQNRSLSKKTILF